MANFSNCLQIVNRMPQQDQDALLARLDELQAQGMSPKEAQLQAAIDVLAQVQSEASIKASVERNDTPEFKRWSRNAPLVLAKDALSYDFRDGKPFVAQTYHGTNSNEDFAEFDLERGGDQTAAESAGMGIFSTSEPVVAGEYAKNLGFGRYLGLAFRGSEDLQQDPVAVRLQKKVDDARKAVSQASYDAVTETIPYLGDVAKGKSEELKRKLAASLLEIAPGAEERMGKIQDATNGLFAAERDLSNYITEYESSKIPQRIMPLYVRMSNPKVYDAKGQTPGDFPLSERIAAAKKAGHDGVVFKNIADPSPVSVHYVSFNPNDVKSATGNSGEFGETASILKSTERLIEDIPNEDWLHGKIEYAQSKGRNQFGVPFMGTITGYFKDPVDVSVRVLSKLKGERDEQNNVREESLDYIRKHWDEVSKQPPYIEVAYNGEAWVSEGNHRIMVAAEKGLDSMPVEIRYFDGGQRRNGPLAPNRIPSLESGDVFSSVSPDDAARDGQYDGDIRFTTERDYEPEKTVTAYKLFRMDPKRPGELFPLFVNANKPVPMGEWLKAEIGPMTGDKVKSKLGPLAFRPGWHAGDVPVATHIGLKDAVTDKAPKYRNPEHVWAEVEFADDVDWQEEANKRGTNAAGKIVPVKAHITDQIPEGGHYRYKTNPNMTGTWLIGGEMKVTRILSDAEVKRINKKAGVADLPRKTPLDLAKYGFDIKASAERPDTPEFKEWFGDSKVVDADGKPLVVYHGSSEKGIEVFESEDGRFYFTDAKSVADKYGRKRGAKKNGETYAVYLSMQNPDVYDMHGESWYDNDVGSDVYGYIMDAKEDGFDGVILKNFVDGATKNSAEPSTIYVVFNPEQIKSATGNNGEYSRTNPDINKSPDRPWFDDLSELKITKTYQLGDLLKSSKKLGWWSRSIGTQYDIAQRHPQFKRVFDAVQRFINDVSAFATHAADLAPTILPKLETWKDIGKSPLSAADVKALRDPIFGGTLKYTRDEDGNIVETDDVSTAGVVFKDEELRKMFGLDDRQIGLYREFRKATNKSLSDLAVSDMLRYLGTDGEGVRQRALDADSLDGALRAMVAHLDHLIELEPARANVYEESKRAIKEKAGQAIGLMARGYAPLSRFGQYTVYVVGKDGEQLYFSMFENQRDANKMAREMQEQYPDATVSTGTMSQESYKLFSGVTPETLALFGESLGMEESGVDAKSEVFQQYLKMAKTNRSAMKRLIQRKGIDGFSEDAGRVLAGFVYSNARQISTNLHAGEIGRSAQAVTDGDVKDAAIRLMEYVQNPREEAQAIRGLLFTQFIGGSIASAMVNMTQPFTMTLPYLSQFDGIAGASKRMADAVRMVSNGVRNDPELKASLKKAEDEGVVSPQEVHQLMAQAQGKGALQTGDGTRAGDAAAKINNAMAKLGLGWGKVFSAAEQFNRRVTFIAAYKLARDQGMSDPMAFAEKAIAETQGVYNKGNKPTWARGAVGSTLFTFKQYSIGYLEFLRRMWGNGPEGKKAVGLALAVLFLASGMGGMPGADDLDDIIDGFMQRVLGRSFDTKQAKKEFFASILGQSGAEFVMSGLSGLPGVPIDISGRMGLGNLVPGTGFFTKKRDYGRDYLEIAGPAGTLFTNIGTAAGQIAGGEVKEGIKTVLPQAGQNFIKAIDMATMGYYRDQKGRKVIDTDAFDVAAKAIGFQPRAVAQVQEATGVQANLVAQNKLRETEIADKWAQGRIERNPAKVEEAKQELADWNRNNPDSKIQIDANQINKRVQEANKSKAQRVAATAPKEIRGAVKRELERVD